MLYLRPTKARITQGFGENPALYPGTNGHQGVDFGLPCGSPIKASADGQVIWAGLDRETVRNPGSGFGNFVEIVHPGGSLSIYGHLESVCVNPGDGVKMGQTIGNSGNTGRSTGPHLHWEIRPNGKNAVDPIPFMVEKNPTFLFAVTITHEGDDLNVRTGPGRDRGIIKQLNEGETAYVVGFTAVNSDIWFLLSDGGHILYKAAWVEME